MKTSPQIYLIIIYSGFVDGKLTIIVITGMLITGIIMTTTRIIIIAIIILILKKGVR